MGAVPKKLKNGVPVRNGRSLNPFKGQLGDLNAEIATFRRPGVKAFITKEDLRWVYDATKGRCSYCELPLYTKGSLMYRPQFMFYQPLQVGGRAVADNIICVCVACKESHGRVRRDKPRELIYNFNTIPDIIERLVEEVYAAQSCEDELIKLYVESVARIKRELNYAITEFVKTLAYSPRVEATAHQVQKRVENNNSAADLVAKIAATKNQIEINEYRRQLVEILKEINIMKEYNLVRV